jgi:hypothetical protein
MKPLYKLMAQRFSKDEIEEMAYDLGSIELTERTKSGMARELFEATSRRLRLDDLYAQINQRNNQLDLKPYLYELIAAVFEEGEMVRLCKKLGVDSLGLGLDEDGFVGWDYDAYLKRNKSWILQEQMEKQEQWTRLLDEIQALKPGLKLDMFNGSQIGFQSEDQAKAIPITGETRPPKQAPGAKTIIHQYFYRDVNEVKVGNEIVHGDKVGGDQVGGDKVGRDKTSVGNITDASGVAIGSEAGAAVSSGGSREDFNALLQTIVKAFEAVKDQLPAGDAKDVADELQDLQGLAAKEKPNSRRLERKLKNVAEIISESGAPTGAADRITVELQQAMEMAQALFGET